MLAGMENFIKPDRMIIRFLEGSIEKKIDPKEAFELMMSVFNELKEEFPNLTPRELDHAIWLYQRNS